MQGYAFDDVDDDDDGEYNDDSDFGDMSDDEILLHL